MDEHLANAEPMVKGIPISQLDSQETRDARVLKIIVEWMSPLGPPDAGLGRVSLSESPQSALPALTVRRGNRGIGRYLKDSKVLVLKDEADRDAAVDAVEQAGLEVMRPLYAHAVGEPLFNGEAKPIGAWGNVIGFYAEIRANAYSPLVALVDLDARALFTVSDVLKPALLARLARMGVTIDVAEPPTPVGTLNAKLDWFTDFGEKPIEVVEPRYQVPAVGPLRVSRKVAEQLPPEVTAAYEEQLRSMTFDPMPKRSEGAYWETTNGVLDADDLVAYRKLAPRGVELPEDWEIEWAMALELSPPHAPVLCAMYLHDSHPDWWDALPATKYYRGGTWLVGHSMSTPDWMRGDVTLEQECRLQCAVALIVSTVDDNLKWLRKKSREKVGCAACGRGFERGMFQTGEVYLLNSASMCGRCTGAGWPSDERDLTPVQLEGILATLRWYVKVAGGVVSTNMLGGIKFPKDLSDEARFILTRPLPGFVMTNWVEWLGRSGVLGEETWRPSYGQISVASDGHACRSFLERVIDDFFSANGVAHETEPPYPYDEVLNQHGLRADWELADGTLVEAAGMLTSTEYAAKIERKELLAAQHGLGLMILDETELEFLPQIFQDYLS